MARYPMRSVCLVASILFGCSSSSSDGSSGNNGAAGNGPIFHVGGTDGSTPSLNQDGGLEALRHMACAGQTAKTEPLPAVMMLVVDTSGSMNDQAPGGGGSKWVVTRNALSGALDALPDSTGVGVLYFPNMNTQASTPDGKPTDPPRPLSACVDANAMIPIDLLGPAGSQHRTQISNSLRNVNGPQGGTPTDDAYRTALPPIENTTLPGSRYIVLITDGQPTFLAGCIGTGNVVDAVDPNPIIADVTSAKSAGVSTFVIGAPGSDQIGNVPFYPDARTWLSKSANIGGTGLPGCNDSGPNFCHFDMSRTTDFSAALRDALAKIVGTVVSCQYPLPIPPNNQTLDRNKVNVVFTNSGGKSALIPQAPAGNCTTGWQYTADNQHLQLCPDTCNTIKADANPTVDVWFGCSTQMGPVH